MRYSVFQIIAYRYIRYTPVAVLVMIILLACSYDILYVHAETSVTDIQSKIEARNADISALEKEIAKFQSEINSLSGQADSLSVAVKSLDLTQNKLKTDISLTENRIAAKSYEIQELNAEISNKSETITDDKRIISHTLALVDEKDDYSLVSLVLGSDSVSSAWNSLNELNNIQSSLGDRIKQIETLKSDLEVNKSASEKAKAALVDLNSELKDQRQVVLNTQAEKNKLLKDTQQSETKYRKILADKQSQKDAFEREVLLYESQLKLAIDSSLLPGTGSSVLAWPLDKVFITQYFGNTPFATANAQVYGGKGHNGIDLRASIGTPIRASLSGVVSGVANTDAVSGCYSYGKWVLVEHPNGLSTLYAHMSLQKVTKGQSVSTGEILGYSGNTGYTTGPHLHYGVYATQGVRIMKLGPGQSIHCTGATIPIADLKAYLNPLSYLPSVPK